MKLTKEKQLFYENATHAVIRRLENSVFKQSLKKQRHKHD